MFLRNNADAELQAAVAQHAVECEKQLADSTAGINNCLSKVSDDNVMHLEEAAVHEVSKMHIHGLRMKKCQLPRTLITYIVILFVAHCVKSRTACIRTHVCDKFCNLGAMHLWSQSSNSITCGTHTPLHANSFPVLCSGVEHCSAASAYQVRRHHQLGPGGRGMHTPPKDCW